MLYLLSFLLSVYFVRLYFYHLIPSKTSLPLVYSLIHIKLLISLFSRCYSNCVYSDFVYFHDLNPYVVDIASIIHWLYIFRFKQIGKGQFLIWLFCQNFVHTKRFYTTNLKKKFSFIWVGLNTILIIALKKRITDDWR